MIIRAQVSITLHVSKSIDLWYGRL
jgi:hypothetical protein